MHLTTERLILRPWQDSDRAAFAAMSADPLMMQFLRPLPTRALADEWIDRQVARQDADGFSLGAALLRDTGELVGSVGLLRIGYEAHFTPAVEVGWRFVRRVWGQGLAPEAGLASLRHGFDALGLETIVATAAPGNAASRRVMEKLGMTRDEAGDFDHPMSPEGDPLRRQVLYRLSQTEWDAVTADQPAGRRISSSS